MSKEAKKTKQENKIVFLCIVRNLEQSAVVPPDATIDKLKQHKVKSINI